RRRELGRSVDGISNRDGAVEAGDLERVDRREQASAQLGGEPAGDLRVDDLSVGQAELENRARLVVRAPAAIFAEAASGDRDDALAQHVEERASREAALAFVTSDPRDAPVSRCALRDVRGRSARRWCAAPRL